MSAEDSERRPKRRIHPWPVGIVAGLATVVVVQVWLIHAALGNAPVLEAPDYYAQSLEYQQVIDERAAAASLGWTVRVEPCDGVSAGRCRLTVEVLDDAGSPVAGLAGSVRVMRADDAALDTEAAVEALPERGYGAELALRRGGLYRVQLRLADAERTWVGERRLWFPGASG